MTDAVRGGERVAPGHTPGPWHVSVPDEGGGAAMVEGAIILSEHNEPVAEVLSVDDGLWERSRFDAVLIAAAPDLLTALQECSTMLRTIAQAHPQFAPALNGMVTAARAAISRATGSPQPNPE